MIERPINFNGEMVRAILDGRKTQTRRPYKVKNGGIWPNRNDLPGMRQAVRQCPYGEVGDRLWVRENWSSGRITLQITNVRVERLQDISEEDAISEGCTKNHNGYFWGGPHACVGTKQLATPLAAFRDLWKSIYKRKPEHSWDENPWVWVIEFERMRDEKSGPEAA